MKRSDLLKLKLTRNWNLPGKERLLSLFKPSDQLKGKINNGIIWLSNENIAIYTDGDSYIEWSIMGGGTYEDEIWKLISISLKPGDTCIDIGGNIGLQSIRMAKCVGNNGIVYAFEPLDHLQEKFHKNVALNKLDNVTLLPFALADYESETEFSVDKKSWNQGTFSLTGSSGSEKQLVKIKIADNIAEIKHLDNLALIKIDVEGFELQVLRGLAETLQRHKPRIIFEFDEDYWKKSNQQISECYLFLKTLGYGLYQVHTFGCTVINDFKEIESGNIFCLPIS